MVAVAAVVVVAIEYCLQQSIVAGVEQLQPPKGESSLGRSAAEARLLLG